MVSVFSDHCFSWVGSYHANIVHSSIEHRETQPSIVDCETVANSVAAGESCQALISQGDYDASREQPLQQNPGTSVPMIDETEPPNQRLFRCSSEAGAEPGKPGPAPVMDAHSIQLESTGPIATHGDYSGAQGDKNEADSTVCQLSEDEVLSRPASPVLEQQKRAGSRSGGEYQPGVLARPCSVSVVIPKPKTYRPRCTGKRKSRPKPPCNVDSDDSDDSDYTDGNDSGVGDIVPSPRPAKRRRRTASMKTPTARVRQETPHLAAQPEELFANPCSAPSLQDIETIPVRGFLTRQTFLSKVVYSCTVEEDRQPCPHRPTKAAAYGENLGQTRHTKQPSSTKPSAHATRFLPDEDELLMELKERRCLPWSRIAKHFPGRTKNSLQVRYSTRLKDRGSGRIKSAPATIAYQEVRGRYPRSRTASNRSVDVDLPTRQRCGPPRTRCAVDRYSPA